jgi:hypothetical protein
MLLVRDVAQGAGVHRLNIRWHLAPDCVPAGGTHWSFRRGADTLAICTAGTEGWTATCGDSTWSPAYGSSLPARAVQLSYEGALPAECGTLLGWNQEDWTIQQAPVESGVSVWLMQSGDRYRIVVFSETSGLWKFEGIESDAALLAFEAGGRARTHCFSAGATTVQLNGVSLSVRRTGDDNGKWSATEVDSAFCREALLVVRKLAKYLRT